MLRLGLTGGIGAGKSTVAEVLAELGGVLVDADKIAREVVEPGTAGLRELTEAFGSDILAQDGSLDRAALAARAFRDEESRLKLNGIVHPLVGKRTAELVDGAPPDSVVVQDIPLLVEGKMGALFQLVVIVWVDAEERVARLVGRRGMPEEDARARIAAQATDSEREEAADVWLDNSGAPGALDVEVRALWENRLVPFERNIREGVTARYEHVLVAADPSWDRRARRLIARLWLVFGADAMRIDHIGSTAVEGLDAKDVLDIQITVSSLEVAERHAESLRRIGFPRVEHITFDDPKPAYGIGGEADPAVWGKRLHGSADPGRPATVHIRVDGWPNQQFALVFVDWLRAEPAERADYLDVKRRAADAAALAPDETTSEVYANAKTPWFDTAYGRAWAWAEKTDWKA